jgi:hypothetical protein
MKPDPVIQAGCTTGYVQARCPICSLYVIAALEVALGNDTWTLNESKVLVVYLEDGRRFNFNDK